jgi:general secretion pathway protein A
MALVAEESFRFFGLDRDPFTPTADPAFFYFTLEFERCLFGLKKSIDSRYGIVLVFGNYGTGKTSLMRHLFYHIARRTHLYNTAVLGSPNPSWGGFTLMEEICNQFRIPVQKPTINAYQSAFNQFLVNNRNRINTLIVDDAQNLDKKEHLETLRLLQNIETPQSKMLNLIMFAQLELIPVIKAQPNFEQRVNNAYVLNPLSYEETANMIRFRLAKAGLNAEENLFDEESLQTIYEFSQGSPRDIVTICRNSMVIAKRIGQPRIQNSIVMYAINNLTVKGLVG